MKTSKFALKTKKESKQNVFAKVANSPLIDAKSGEYNLLALIQKHRKEVSYEKKK